MQRAASITDQLRNVENYCDRVGLPKPVIFKDEAITGSRNDRPGYLEMLSAAHDKAFDILLVDDLGRMTRDNIETLTAIRQLKFLGIQVIGVSDGIDTSREGHKIEIALRGLMNEAYVDELAKKTHRGMMGQALNGLSTGAKIYGYKSIPAGDGQKRIIDEDQANWVRYIFERFSEGASTRQIVKELFEKGVPPPRGGKWTHSAIHSKFQNLYSLGIVSNSIYIGKHVWNRTASAKNPMTGKTKSVPRPKEDWVHTDCPELRIIDDETWARCEARIAATNLNTEAQKARGKKSGGGVSKYLFSGLLRCGVCGERFTLSTRISYGCSSHLVYGNTACSNNLTIKRSTLEKVLLSNIKQELLSEEAYRSFESEARALLKNECPDATPIKKKMSEAQKEVDNLMAAIKAGIITLSTKSALVAAEQQVVEAEKELKTFDEYQPTQILPRARGIFTELVTTLEKIGDVSAAREALRKLIGHVVLKPENGLLTAEIASSGLNVALQMASSKGAHSTRHLQSLVRFPGLK
jgi:DNA invertase Pin-like site-specific DNA recombinase